MKNLLAALLLLIACALVSSAQTQSSPNALEKNNKFLISISIRLLQTSVKAGSPVSLLVTRTNTSDHAIDDTRFKDPIYNYAITVKDNQQNPAPETQELRRIQKQRTPEGRMSGSFVQDKLDPGQSDGDLIELSLYYDLTKPGEYAIQIEKPLKSNTIKLTITP